MKIFLLTISLSLIMFLNCSEDINENDLINQANILTKNKSWRKSDSLFTILLKKFNKSNSRENYYNALDWMIDEQIWDIRKSYYDSNNDTTAGTKGTITLTLSLDMKRLGPDIKYLLDRKIELSKDYISEFPHGQLIANFYGKLLAAYRALGRWVEVVDISTKLFESDNKEFKLIGAFELAINSHFCKKYGEAIKYYNYLLQNTNDLDKKIKYNFYIADCYWGNGNIDESRKYHNNVFEMSKGLNEKKRFIEKIAKITLEYINNYENKPNIPRREFVIFKDPANE